MKTQLWVETHQPVPLVPLSMLRIEPGDVIYIGKARPVPYGQPWQEYNADDKWTDTHTGWFQVGRNGLAVSLDTAEYIWLEDLEDDASMGRRLQPNESVLVRYTSR